MFSASQKSTSSFTSTTMESGDETNTKINKKKAYSQKKNSKSPSVKRKTNSLRKALSMEMYIIKFTILFMKCVLDNIGNSIEVTALGAIMLKKNSKSPSVKRKTNSPMKVTRTALVVSICFNIVFLPYVVVKLIAAITEDNIMAPSAVTSILLPILSRTHFGMVFLKQTNIGLSMNIN
jgi:hypothetical protein